MLVNFFLGKRSISLIGCGAQIFFTSTLGIALSLPDTHCLWPLCDYLSSSQILNHYQPLGLPADGCGVLEWEGLWHPWSTWLMPCTFPLCGSWELYHFFCEVKALMKLSCEDISAYEKGLAWPALLGFFSPQASFWLPILSSSSRSCKWTPRRQEQALATTPPILLCHILLCPSHANIHEAWIFSHLCSEPGSLCLTPSSPPCWNPLIYSPGNREVVGSIRKMLRM